MSTLAANPLAALGGIYQDARELPLVVNVIDTFPRALANLPPAVGAGLATSTRLRVQTRARPRSATRVGLSFERVAVEQLALFGQAAPDWLPKPAVLSRRGHFAVESRRRRGRDADIPWRRVAAAPRLRRGYFI